MPIVFQTANEMNGATSKHRTCAGHILEGQTKSHQVCDSPARSHTQKCDFPFGTLPNLSRSKTPPPSLDQSNIISYSKTPTSYCSSGIIGYFVLIATSLGHALTRAVRLKRFPGSGWYGPPEPLCVIWASNHGHPSILSGGGCVTYPAAAQARVDHGSFWLVPYSSDLAYRDRGEPC